MTIVIVEPIKELRHQDYHGKSATLELIDLFGNIIGIKLDIGVSNRLDIEQEEYCFELACINDKVTLYMNSKEQLITEKLKSLLKLGRFSTRYKDLFAIYYFITVAGVDMNKLTKCLHEFIFEAKETTTDDIAGRLRSIFQDKAYLKKADTVHNNWLEVPFVEVTKTIIAFFSENIE